MQFIDDKKREENRPGAGDSPVLLPIKKIVQSQAVREGAGVLVHRAFPTREMDYFDPFLLLDEMGPTEFASGQATGFPEHPHKGFETVTYLLAGGMRHRDSAGNSGFLKPGDVQWMTAGRGIVHSEMPDPDFARTGGLMHGFQLWVNLPRKDKLVPPRYQDLQSSQVPEATSLDGLTRIKIIAGQALGVVAPIETKTDMMYLHFRLQPGAAFVQPVPSHFNAMAYIVSGAVTFDSGEGLGVRSASTGQLILFDALGANTAGGAVSFSSSNQAAELLLIGGEPINEPVARYGPFVMNTKDEILQAVQEYQDGTLGQILH